MVAFVKWQIVQKYKKLRNNIVYTAQMRVWDLHKMNTEPFHFIISGKIDFATHFNKIYKMLTK